jgi:hypothetical protein
MSKLMVHLAAKLCKRLKIKTLIMRVLPRKFSKPEKVTGCHNWMDRGEGGD